MKIKIDLKIFIFLIFLFFMKKLEYYFLFMFFIILHEIGHLISGIILGYKPKEINLNITGISLEFYNYNIDKKDLAKIVVLLSGPIINIILSIIYYSKNIEIAFINVVLATVNLLPILPLDGGKILKIIMKKIWGYKKGIKISEYISKIFLYTLMLTYSICILYVKNFAIFIFLIYLLVLNHKENKMNDLRIRVFETLENMK